VEGGGTDFVYDQQKKVLGRDSSDKRVDMLQEDNLVTEQ